MNEPVIQEKIDAIVTAWVAEGRMFTAYEVSLQVQKQGVRERHRRLREQVHATIFRIGGPREYSRTLMGVGAPEQAWVYHPKTTSPYHYRPLERDGMAPVSADEPVVAYALHQPCDLVWGSPAQAHIPAGAYGTDQRGRLCIPVHFLTRLGVRAGERVKIQCETGSGRLSITKLGALERTPPDAVYTTEPDGNVRLTQTTLDKADIAGGQSYHIDGDDSAITVRRFEEE